MDLEQIHSMWAEDAARIKNEGADQSLDAAQLHSKYYKILSAERMRYKKLKEDVKPLRLDLIDYWSGRMSVEQMKTRGWEWQPEKNSNSVAADKADADQRMIDLNLKIAYQEEKIQLLLDIIKNINGMSYTIRNYIEWQKFTRGADYT